MQPVYFQGETNEDKLLYKEMSQNSINLPQKYDLKQ